MFTIYAWGILIIVLITVYSVYNEKQDEYSPLNNEEPEFQTALVLSIFLIAIFWPISVPFSIYLKLTNKNDNGHF